MAEHEIAHDEKFEIICPYCFNQAEGGNGEPFPHTAVEFRAETIFESEKSIEREFGNRTNIEMMTDKYEKEKALEKYEKAKRFLVGMSDKYQRFWAKFDGITTEQEDESCPKMKKVWQLPIIGLKKGATRIVADQDGFVTHAIDDFGTPTYRRVCPHCHNPLPLGYGKTPVKYISIIGVMSSGKTVYISQLLRNLGQCIAKSGLSAFCKSSHETDFIKLNNVCKGVPLPPGTSKNSFSQPMFYDIVQSNGVSKRQETIVLYDIAGETCVNNQAIINVANFVKHSDGIILLIDPKSLGFITSDVNNQGDAVVAPSVLDTLHNTLECADDEKCRVPLAISISKSDSCFDILPALARDQLEYVGKNASGRPTFDGRSYNQLSPELASLVQKNDADLFQKLCDNYINFNFFAVSAMGCGCDSNNAPVDDPRVIRIEEPILWLFKQWGFIDSNAKVLRPEKIAHAQDRVYVRKFFGRPRLERKDVEFSEYEEDPIRTEPRVLKGNKWESYDEYRYLDCEEE